MLSFHLIEKLHDVGGLLAFVGPTFSCISEVLSGHNIKAVGLLPRKVASFLQHIKDDLSSKTDFTYLPIGLHVLPCPAPCSFSQVHFLALCTSP